MCGKITFTPYTKEERDALIEACGLTDRQKEVFVTRAQTDSLIATAQRLHISPETVKRESRRVQIRSTASEQDSDDKRNVLSRPTKHRNDKTRRVKTFRVLFCALN